MSARTSMLWGMAASCLFVAVLLAILFKLGLRQQVTDLLTWIESLGYWGPLAFVILDVFVVILLLPGVLLTLGAGFLFGAVLGSVLVVVATTIGAVIAFTLARFTFGEKFVAYLRSHSKLAALDNMFTRDDWKLVFFTRLIPFFPFKLSNYLFGLTSLSLRGFSTGTFLGVWPITITNVYIGSVTANIASLGSDTAGRTSFEWFVYGGGFILAVTSVIYLSRRAQDALAPFFAETPCVKKG